MVGLGGWLPRFLCPSWHFENCASIEIDDVLAEDGGLPHVLALAVHLNFLDTFLTLWGSQGFYLNHILPPRPFKSYRVVGTAGYIVAQPATWWTAPCPSSHCPPDFFLMDK